MEGLLFERHSTASLPHGSLVYLASQHPCGAKRNYTNGSFQILILFCFIHCLLYNLPPDSCENSGAPQWAGWHPDSPFASNRSGLAAYQGLMQSQQHLPPIHNYRVEGYTAASEPRSFLEPLDQAHPDHPQSTRNFGCRWEDPARTKGVIHRHLEQYNAGESAHYHLMRRFPGCLLRYRGRCT